MSDDQTKNSPTLLNNVTAVATSDMEPVAKDTIHEDAFNFDLVKKYPKSNKKISLNVAKFGISADDVLKEQNGHSVHISPYGIEFKTTEDFIEGSLLKIHINIPDYWQRKQKLVDYTRIDAPNDFRVLAKVVRAEDMGKRGKKRVVTVQTLVIDDVDEQVLKTFLQEE